MPHNMGHKTISDDVCNGATKSNLTMPNTRNWNINYPIDVLTSDVISPLKRQKMENNLYGVCKLFLVNTVEKN